MFEDADETALLRNEVVQHLQRLKRNAAGQPVLVAASSNADDVLNTSAQCQLAMLRDELSAVDRARDMLQKQLDVERAERERLEQVSVSSSAEIAALQSKLQAAEALLEEQAPQRRFIKIRDVETAHNYKRVAEKFYTWYQWASAERDSAVEHLQRLGKFTANERDAIRFNRLMIEPSHISDELAAHLAIAGSAMVDYVEVPDAQEDESHLAESDVINRSARPDGDGDVHAQHERSITEAANVLLDISGASDLSESGRRAHLAILSQKDTEIRRLSLEQAQLRTSLERQKAQLSRLHIAEFQRDDERRRAEVLDGKVERLLEELAELKAQLRTDADGRASIAELLEKLAGEKRRADEAERRLSAPFQ